jgi:HSP20 family protein
MRSIRPPEGRDSRCSDRHEVPECGAAILNTAPTFRTGWRGESEVRILLKKPMNPITPWHPFRELEDWQDRILRALRPSRSQEGRQLPALADWAPSVDITEDEKEYLIKAELPEVKKEDVKVTIDKGVVSIHGERKFEKEEKNKKYHRVERSYGCFHRSFSLPEDADSGKVTAEFKEGILEVRLGKTETKAPKAVEVTVG